LGMRTCGLEKCAMNLDLWCKSNAKQSKARSAKLEVREVRKRKMLRQNKINGLWAEFFWFWVLSELRYTLAVHSGCQASKVREVV
jgi:hypothetical protein